ncbi:hypothetical protein GQR42_20020 [Microcystis aeruginosa FD4]|uniref:Uncharacterized protein n=2 Tax=Microcystis aeruginosa TaxID=1126 RepID=A0A857D7D2_MICAE|nr:hypothetical protein GQR42_20020 [Microcystis aeruginosa FD4]
MVNFPYPHNQRERGVKCRLSYSLCDKFNLYKTDQSLCPLCLCGSFHLLASRNVFYNTFYPPNPRE